MKTQNKFFTPASAFNKKFDMKQPFLRVHVKSAQSQHILLFFLWHWTSTFAVKKLMKE